MASRKVVRDVNLSIARLQKKIVSSLAEDTNDSDAVHEMQSQVVELQKLSEQSTEAIDRALKEIGQDEYNAQTLRKLEKSQYLQTVTSTYAYKRRLREAIRSRKFELERFRRHSHTPKNGANPSVTKFSSERLL